MVKANKIIFVLPIKRKNMRNKLFIVLVLITIPTLLFSQRRTKYKSKRWKSYRYEFDMGIGGTNFLGDLGGANQIGTNYFKDLEFSMTRLAVSAGMRYRLSPTIAIHPHIMYGKVAGDDKLTTEFFRSYRNLNFKSNIWEVNCNVEAFILKEQLGRKYKLRGVKGRKSFEVGMYLFAGIGAFRFNPKGEYEGAWYKLRPLHTEGQTFVETRKNYSRVQLCIPVGIGFKYNFDRRWGMTLEYGIRKTFTDYIDDVSKTYFDKNTLLSQENGALAYALSDKSDNSYPGSTGAGQQRGDPRDKDAYMFAVFSVTYKLRTGRVNYPIF